ncbi:hypothetical protein [Plastoroseomonas hellenica]|uniref:Uncharacterized protein n=1 Tax=Plastoroseomonas hellenica TaxID=2687306 RepID=A0ABS5F773_9PROT|nr:hypothetical protein [Plastoroseomonas hellenica]MBR0646602.1 hypothetical protein [Plastoroseomonas hellenica]MBR0668422.1 hypothetical protein [Plastoroseomonas hellenica]
MITIPMPERPRPLQTPAEMSLAVDLDERAVLYPAGKGVTRVTLSAVEGGIAFDAAFAFNESRASPRIMVLSLDDAREFGRRLVDSVYQARAQNAITETMRIGITVHTNGFHLQIGDVGSPTELFIGLSSIWRFAQTVLRAVDRLSPVEAH